jgi:Na+-translocating ferredoxin:NAD+ oxidoreductase subunit B
MMHTVIEPHCTGCELCIAVCPVDCISLENVTGEQTGWAAWSEVQADQALERYTFHSCSRTYSLGSSLKLPSKTAPNTAKTADKQSVIEEALAKARAARSA